MKHTSEYRVQLDTAKNGASWATLLRRSVDFLIPNRCPVCDQPNATAGAFCTPCSAKLPTLDHCCYRCGQQFVGLTEVCGRCVSQPPHYDQCVSAFSYEGGMQTQIQKLKYAEQPFLAKQLARLLVQTLREHEVQLPDVVVPVPMHIKRLRGRGYNQSALIAREVAKQMGLPYSCKLIEKISDTPAQASLSLKQRHVKIENSFQTRSNAPSFKHIAIVDDVLTTGATANEIARVLRNHGTDYIQVWTLAHKC